MHGVILSGKSINTVKINKARESYATSLKSNIHQDGITEQSDVTPYPYMDNNELIQKFE